MEEVKKSPAMEEHLNEGVSRPAVSRQGPTWRAWVVTLLAAIVLSVTATLLLGGSGSFLADPAPAAVGAPADAEGCGGGCCGERGK
jgi:hypothetical protein